MNAAWIILAAGAIFGSVSASAKPAASLQPAPQIDRILVDKSDRLLTVFAGSTPLKTYRIALGANPIGDKEKQGDDRTPEGFYKIDRKIPNSEFTRGLGISYPNDEDRRQARARGVNPGGDIVIHGTPDFIEPILALGHYPDWTRGCIALSTAQMRELYDLVPVGTPIEIRP